jgi:hypothetical protein
MPEDTRLRGKGNPSEGAGPGARGAANKKPSCKLTFLPPSHVDPPDPEPPSFHPAVTAEGHVDTLPPPGDPIEILQAWKYLKLDVRQNIFEGVVQALVAITTSVEGATTGQGLVQSVQQILDALQPIVNGQYRQITVPWSFMFTLSTTDEGPCQVTITHSQMLQAGAYTPGVGDKIIWSIQSLVTGWDDLDIELLQQKGQSRLVKTRPQKTQTKTLNPGTYTISSTTLLKVETASFADELQKFLDALLSATSLVKALEALAESMYQAIVATKSPSPPPSYYQQILLNPQVIAATKDMVLKALGAIKAWLTVLEGGAELKQDDFTITCSST